MEINNVNYHTQKRKKLKEIKKKKLIHSQSYAYSQLFFLTSIKPTVDYYEKLFNLYDTKKYVKNNLVLGLYNKLKTF